PVEFGFAAARKKSGEFEFGQTREILVEPGFGHRRTSPLTHHHARGVNTVAIGIRSQENPVQENPARIRTAAVAWATPAFFRSRSTRMCGGTTPLRNQDRYMPKMLATKRNPNPPAALAQTTNPVLCARAKPIDPTVTRKAHRLRKNTVIGQSGTRAAAPARCS